ncbi:PDF receptor [Eufriesea mexicana]|uniref:PDF receptor n=1 Tax=Eufriesea mexicana TaxID=516756 RepID=A0A310SE57_9HYME|nr:PDF receptor [Eufriesea mexicana]
MSGCPNSQSASSILNDKSDDVEEKDHSSDSQTMVLPVLHPKHCNPHIQSFAGSVEPKSSDVRLFSPAEFVRGGFILIALDLKFFVRLLFRCTWLIEFEKEGYDWGRKPKYEKGQKEWFNMLSATSVPRAVRARPVLKDQPRLEPKVSPSFMNTLPTALTAKSGPERNDVTVFVASLFFTVYPIQSRFHVECATTWMQVSRVVTIRNLAGDLKVSRPMDLMQFGVESPTDQPFPVSQLHSMRIYVLFHFLRELLLWNLILAGSSEPDLPNNVCSAFMQGLRNLNKHTAGCAGQKYWHSMVVVVQVLITTKQIDLKETESVEKKCGYNGRWEGQNGTSNEDSPHGWANYTTCLTPEMLRLHGKVYTNTVEGDMKMDIAEKTRTLEFVGLSISLVALLASLAIFCRFRSLRNTRTRIHKNLFVAMVVQVLIRLIVYIDMEILRRKTYGIQRGIGNTPVLCEASYALLEYTKTAMFMWMFIEGLFLHNMVTVTVFQENSYYRMYRFIGWGCPVMMTLIWAIITAFYYHPKSKLICPHPSTLSLILHSVLFHTQAFFHDYAFSMQPQPRAAFVPILHVFKVRSLKVVSIENQFKVSRVLNQKSKKSVVLVWIQSVFLFLDPGGTQICSDIAQFSVLLLNIVRVLVVKLRQSHTSEIEQVLKAVRAAVVLLPLLGITNVLFMIEAPLHNVEKFALWSYSTHFLQSFQGFIIATIYCFLNGEVRQLAVRLALDKTISVYLSLRGTDLQARRQSTFSGCQPQRIASVIEMEEEEMRSSGWIRLCCRGGNTPPPDRPAE